MSNNTDTDNWGQLLSDFGIEDQIQEKPVSVEQPQTVSPAETIESSAKNFDKNVQTFPESPAFDDFGAGLIDSETEVSDVPTPVESTGAESTGTESTGTREKKSIFSRFPKVNFFGAPPQVSLDSVIEGVKSPSLGGKGFADNKLEKVPLSQERSSRKEKKKAEEPNSWSMVASQIETLASSDESNSKLEERVAKRHISSMFDDPIPESEESRALKNLIGEPAPQEQKRREAFLDEESGSRRRDRGRRQPSAPVEEREPRGRGARYKPPVEVDEFVESDFEPLEEVTPAPRERGRRGSRYAGERSRYDHDRVRDEEPQEEWSEVDAALQADQERPAPRADRYRRDDDFGRNRRGERPRKQSFDREREPRDEEDSGIVMAFESVPSWDDAIGDIISGNISRHRSSSGRGRRG